MSIFSYWSEDAYSYLLTPPGYGLCIAVIVLLLIFASRLCTTPKTAFNTKRLAYCSICIALATVTSLIKLTDLPMGGSITAFSMFFICFVGYLYGTGTGIITGVAYGIIQLMIDGYVIHPIQLMVDYPLAFGALGLSGVFSDSKHGLFKGVLLGVLGRYICHFITGVVYFNQYAPESVNAGLYSALYNGSYIVPELIITLILITVPSVKNALKTVKASA